jgi:hypothetical protein
MADIKLAATASDSTVFKVRMKDSGRKRIAMTWLASGACAD